MKVPWDTGDSLLLERYSLKSCLHVFVVISCNQLLSLKKLFLWEIIVTVSIKSTPAWIYFLFERLNFAGCNVIVEYLQFECQTSHTIFLVAKDVSSQPVFVGFLKKLNASSKFTCWGYNITTSSWSSQSRFISWLDYVSCVESLLFCFLAFGVIRVGVSFWVTAFSGAVNTLFKAFAGVDGSSAGIVGIFDEGKVIGISPCSNVSSYFRKTNRLFPPYCHTKQVWSCSMIF